TTYRALAVGLKPGATYRALAVRPNQDATYRSDVGRRRAWDPCRRRVRLWPDPDPDVGRWRPDHMPAPGWTESDSATYPAIADVAVPRRREMVATILAAVPFARRDVFRVVELGCGDGQFGAALLHRYPSATLLALDGSEHMQRLAVDRLARFGERAQV